MFAAKRSLSLRLIYCQDLGMYGCKIAIITDDDTQLFQHPNH